MTASVGLYYFPLSPPSRAVILVANAVGVVLNLTSINIMEGEQNEPSFLKVNPQHTVPTMVDGDLTVWESRAIMGYLVNQYGSNDSLYPKDPKQRALVDSRLYFDSGTLYQRISDYFFTAINTSVKDACKKAKADEALEWLDIFLKDKDWVAGRQMTIADFSIIVSISQADVVGFDISKYSNISAWYERCKKAMADYDYENINQKAADTFGELFKSKVKT